MAANFGVVLEDEKRRFFEAACMAEQEWDSESFNKALEAVVDVLSAKELEKMGVEGLKKESRILLENWKAAGIEERKIEL